MDGWDFYVGDYLCWDGESMTNDDLIIESMMSTLMKKYPDKKVKIIREHETYKGEIGFTVRIVVEGVLDKFFLNFNDLVSCFQDLTGITKMFLCIRRGG